MKPINPSQNPSHSCAFGSIGGSDRRPRPDDILGNLPEADQQLILGWVQEMGLRPAVAQIAKPRPEGLGLSIHYTSLRRFYEKRSRADFDFPDLSLRPAGQSPFDDITFAIICRKIEEEILIGLDTMENRKETIQLLSVYVRLRALHQKNSSRRHRKDFSVTQPDWPSHLSHLADPVASYPVNAQPDDSPGFPSLPAASEPAGHTGDFNPPQSDVAGCLKDEVQPAQPVSATISPLPDEARLCEPLQRDPIAIAPSPNSSRFDTAQARVDAARSRCSVGNGSPGGWTPTLHQA